MSPDGYISITGRIKDLIIRGGENIHPLEIENCLLSHPEVSEVSVVGVPDERYGEAVAAFVVPLDAALHHGGEEGKHRTAITAQQIREWVREKLSNHLGRPFDLLFFCPLIFVALFEVRADYLSICFQSPNTFSSFQIRAYFPRLQVERFKNSS